MKLEYGQGQCDTFLDLTTGKVHAYRAHPAGCGWAPGVKNPTGGVHAAHGGRQFYESQSGRSGAGYIHDKPTLIQVPSLRCDTKYPEWNGDGWDLRGGLPGVKLGEHLRAVALTHPDWDPILALIEDDRSAVMFLSKFDQDAPEKQREVEMSGEIWTVYGNVWWGDVSTDRVVRELVIMPFGGRGRYTQDDWQCGLNLVTVNGETFSKRQRAGDKFELRENSRVSESDIERLKELAPWAHFLKNPGQERPWYITRCDEPLELSGWQTKFQLTNSDGETEPISWRDALRLLGSETIYRSDRFFVTPPTPEPKPAAEPEPLADWEKELLNLPE